MARLVEHRSAATDIGNLSSWTVQDLRAELSSLISVSATTLARMALIWQELERRGEDLSALKRGIGRYMPAIASGRLIPEAVIQLAGNRPALRLISLLEPAEQERVLKAGHITVADARGPAREIPLSEIDAISAARAVDIEQGRIIPVADQRTILRRRRVQKRYAASTSLSEDQMTALRSHADASGRSLSDFIQLVLCNAGVLTTKRDSD